MLVIVVVTVACGLLAWRTEHAALVELKAVERLKQKGFSFGFHDTPRAWLWTVAAKVGFDPRLGQQVKNAHFAGDLSALRDLSDLALLSALRDFTLFESDEGKDNRTVVTDTLLAPLNCGILEHVVINAKSGLSDRFLERFAGSTRIEAIVLDESQITDLGMKHLARCPNLSGISVEGCTISNAGVEAVIDLPSLNRLFLDRTKVDAGVLPILARRELASVYLCGTPVTLANAIEFTKSHQLLMRVGDPDDAYEVLPGESYRLKDVVYSDTE